jgi:hypothetical protein
MSLHASIFDMARIEKRLQSIQNTLRDIEEVLYVLADEDNE